MKAELSRYLVATLSIISIASCATFDKYSSRHRPTGIGPNEAITIVGDEKYIDCLSNGIQGEDSDIRIIPQAEIRDRLSPEAKEKPLDWRNDSKIHDHMVTMNIRYLIEVSGETTLSKGKSETIWYGIPLMAIPMGSASKKRKETKVDLNIFEVKSMHSAGHLKVSTAGTQHFVLLGIAPIFVPAITEHRACKKMGKRTVSFLKGIDLPDQTEIDRQPITTLHGEDFGRFVAEKIIGPFFIGLSKFTGLTKPNQCSPISIKAPTVPVSRKKIHASIGVYYSPKFRQKVSWLNNSNNCFSIGSLSVDMLNEVLNQVFENVAEADKLPPIEASDLNIDGIIEPILDNPDDPLRRPFGNGGITYHFNLYSPKGELLSKFRVKGEVSAGAESDSITKAMEDAAKNFRPAFLKDMGVQRWLYQVRSNKVVAP